MMQKLEMPSIDDICSCQEAVNRKYPSIGEVWVIDDGLKLAIQVSVNEAVPNHFGHMIII